MNSSRMNDRACPLGATHPPSNRVSSQSRDRVRAMKQFAAAGKRTTWLSSHFGVTIAVVEKLIAPKKKARRRRLRAQKKTPPSPRLVEAVAVAG